MPEPCGPATGSAGRPYPPSCLEGKQLHHNTLHDEGWASYPITESLNAASLVGSSAKEVPQWRALAKG